MDNQTMQEDRIVKVMLLSPTDNVVVATTAMPQGALLPQAGLHANHDTP